MSFKKWYENKKVQWPCEWPNRQGTGDDPHAGDTPPEILPDGHYLLYHGTNMVNAKKILEQRKITKDDMGYVGICTTPSAAGTYASMKSSQNRGLPEDNPSVVLRLIVDKDWFLKQEISRECGGRGRDQWLIHSEEMPPEAIRAISIYSIWGERQ
jgi:hypothetical protein